MIEPPPSAELLATARLIAARFALGSKVQFQARQLADALLSEGCFDVSFMPLLNQDENDDQLRSFFSTLELGGMSVEEAVWSLLGHHIQRIATGSVGPFEGMQDIIMEVWGPADVLNASRHFAGDIYGLEHLYGTYHDDWRSRSELEAELVREAREWVQRYGENSRVPAP